MRDLNSSRMDVEAIISSPYHPEGNVRTEAWVKAMKTLVKKTRDIKRNLFLKAKFEWKNIPRDQRRSTTEIMFDYQILFLWKLLCTIVHSIG
uniref:Integrase catalytic domain-containing protein n=1 Tax=Lepeophtheirus salmonis TaxID=72036 RepID=A0A0K2V130_LEPSM